MKILLIENALHDSCQDLQVPTVAEDWWTNGFRKEEARQRQKTHGQCEREREHWRRWRACSKVEKMHMRPKFIDPCVTLSTKWRYCESDFPILETSVFFIPVLITYISETVLRIFVEICNIYANQLIIKMAISVIKSDKLSRSYDVLYLGVGFFGT